MVAKNVIAKRYAKALFKAASESAAVEQVIMELDAIAQAITKDKMKLKALTSEVIPMEKKRNTWKKILSGKLHSLTINYINTLISNNRLDILLDSLKALEDISNTANGIIPIKITSVSELTEKQIKTISDLIEKSINSKVLTTTSTDKSILGGLIIRIGSNMLDLSIKAKLMQVKKFIKTVTV